MLLYVYRLTIFFIDIDIICYTLSGMFSSVTNFSFIDILTTNGGLFTNIMLAEMTTFKKQFMRYMDIVHFYLLG